MCQPFTDELELGRLFKRLNHFTDTVCPFISRAKFVQACVCRLYAGLGYGSRTSRVVRIELFYYSGTPSSILSSNPVIDCYCK